MTAIVFLSNVCGQDPVPAVPWTKPLRTTADTKPWQRDIFYGNISGTEDCLHVNVYTKQLDSHPLCPVMVYLHGGGFMNGSNCKDVYNPEFLLRKDVVLVVVNYRLGALGRCQWPS